MDREKVIEAADTFVLAKGKPTVELNGNTLRHWMADFHIEQSAKQQAENAQLKLVLAECRQRWDRADDGKCEVCYIGYRKYDTKGNVQHCENADCLSHRIREALEEQK